LKLLAINQSSGGSAPMSSGVLIMDLIDPDRIDGAIVMTREVPQEQVEALAAKIPVVWLGHESILPRIAGVQNDVIGGAYDAARHLAALGHRNISLVTIAESFAQGRDQRRGVRLGLRDLLTQGDATLNVWEAGRNSTDDGHRLGREFLAKPDRPTAVICGSDELAVGVYRAASEIGLQVPGQLSIIGWNDSPILEAIPVPMTSVRIDHKQLGAASVQHVRKLIETPYASEESELLPVELIVRKSTAAPDSSLSADGKPAHSQ
jgi:DNA-binding LacI/PurR family transcriptional regulator